MASIHGIVTHVQQHQLLNHNLMHTQPNQCKRTKARPSPGSVRAEKLLHPHDPRAHVPTHVILVKHLVKHGWHYTAHELTRPQAEL